MRNVVNDTIIVFMVTDGSYPCGEHSIMHREVQSLCRILDINIKLCDKNTINIKIDK